MLGWRVVRGPVLPSARSLVSAATVAVVAGLLSGCSGGGAPDPAAGPAANQQASAGHAEPAVAGSVSVAPPSGDAVPADDPGPAPSPPTSSGAGSGGETTTPTDSTAGRPVASGDRFATRPAGEALPSGADCASSVRPSPETRADNAGYNATRGTGANDRYPLVDGNFTGTTDEIIQWAACKWGIDEDIARAQVAKESWWHMSTGGDLTANQDDCHVELRTGAGRECPESIGLMQVRWLYHMEAFEGSNAIRSSAYNVDYGFAVWRDCYDGNLDWLNTVERGADYGAGDLDGCLGVWFSGRWRTPDAETYITGVHDLLDQRIWEQGDFLGG
jgi:autotransporter family porin